MTQIAAGSESMDVEDWMPSKIYLSVPLMWEILQFNFEANSQGTPTPGLLDASLTPLVIQEDAGESSTLEIIVATSPEITINTADGGQEAPTFSFKAPVSSSSDSARNLVCEEISVEQTDNLTFNTTPWLYADFSQFMGIGDIGVHDSQPDMDETRGMAWWEDENLGTIMLNPL